jgi:peptidoglycan/LPS O-acetylase OafA/YrhL
MTHSKTIDGMRAYMAWWVVLAHSVALAGPLPALPHFLYTLFTLANVPVYVFIVISGFVITHLIIRSPEEHYPAYITRRGFRIVPVYLFALLVMSLVYKYFIQIFTASWRPEAGLRLATLAAERQHFWLYLFLHLSLLHGVVPDNVLPYSSSAFLAPAWSLSLEWQFYLIAPLMIRLPGKWRYWSVAILAIVCAMTFVASGSLHFQWVFPSNLFCALGYFALGILSRYRFQGVPWRRLWHYILIVLAMLGGIVYTRDWIILRCVAMGLAIWAMGLWMIQREISGWNRTDLLSRAVKGLFCSRFITSAGSWSYSTYLLHLPVLVAVITLFLNVCPGTPTERLRLSFLVSIPLVVLVSYGTYTWLEKPAMRLGKNVAGLLQTVQPARVRNCELSKDAQ